MKNYLINVIERKDRLKNMVSRFSAVEMKFELVEAITGAELTSAKIDLLTRPNTEANWRSIQKALRVFLGTTDEYCCIFEDDVLFLDGFVSFYEKLLRKRILDVDILQFGYLTFKGKNDDGKSNSYKRFQSFLRQRIVRIDSTIEANLTKTIFNLIIGLFKINLEYELCAKRLQEQLELELPLIPGFEPGTHGFLISRKMANLVIDFNIPMILSADLVFMTLSKNKKLKIFRTGKPLATQDDTKPSINGHASHIFDLAYELLESKLFFTKNISACNSSP